MLIFRGGWVGERVDELKQSKELLDVCHEQVPNAADVAADSYPGR